MENNHLAVNFFPCCKTGDEGSVTDVRHVFDQCHMHGVHGALAEKRLNSAISGHSVQNSCGIREECCASTLHHAIAANLHPLVFSGAEGRSPDRVKRMYARKREAALRQAGEVLEIVARHLTSVSEPQGKSE